MIQARPDGMVVVASDRSGRPRAINIAGAFTCSTRRAYNLSLLTVFDQPLVATNCLKRGASAVPLQSLFMLNDAFLAEQADHFARRVERCCSGRSPSSGSTWRFGWCWRVAPTPTKRRRVAICCSRQTELGLARRHDRRRGRAPGPRPALPDPAQHQRVLVRGMMTLMGTARTRSSGDPHGTARPASDREEPHGSVRGRPASDRPPGFLAAGDPGLRHGRAGPPARTGTSASRRGVPGATGGTDLRPRPGHFPARARSVIMLMQVGGPSQIDLFDPKPELRRRDGQEYRGDVEMLQPGSETKKLMASPFRFRPHGAVRHGALGTAPRDRLGGRRRVPGPLDVQRQQQSPAGHALPARRQDLPGPAVGRLVDQLCPGDREPEPAGLCRAARSRRLQQRRHDDVGERLAAGHLPGDRDPVARRGRPRPASRRRPARRHAAQQPRDAGSARTRNGASSIRTSPSWTRASATTSWRRGCSSAPRRCSTSPARPRRPDGFMGSTTR